MGRRLLVAAAVVLLFVGIGAGVALSTRDDSSDSTASSTSTSASTSSPTTTAPATTTSEAATTTTTTTAAPEPTELPDPCGAEGATIKATIDAGALGRRTVVCGAPNCRPGILTAYVPVGKKVVSGVESACA
jgi:cytoskeletal protein RodZ